MSRLKGDCQVCGKRVASAKLISLPKSDKKLCIYCRKKELHKRDKACVPQINTLPGNSQEISKKSVRSTKFVRGGLTMEEEQVLKLKYGHDSFKSGNTSCLQLRNLKNKLRDQKITKIKVQKENVKKTIIKKELNKKFIDGLK